MRATWATTAIRTAAMTGNGTHGGLRLMNCSSQAGALPPGFVYLRDVEPSVVQDMRYAGSDNFVGRPLPGYGAAECVLRKEVAAATDVLAIGILHAAADMGIAVPQEFSVTGFDDIPFAAMTVPALTTVRMPVEKMIKAAVTMAVDKRLRNAAGTPRGLRLFRPTIVVRRSTERLAK